jgi:hypothetical protein
VATEAGIQGAEQRPCGIGCWRFRVHGRPRRLTVTVPEAGRRYSASLPIRWTAAGEARARSLLDRAQTAMRELRSVREAERITSGPGTRAVTNYRLRAPDRFAYTTDRGTRSIVVGSDQWLRTPELDRWERRDFGAGTTFSTRSWFRWTPYAESLQLIDIRRGGRRRTAELGLYERGTSVWYRLWIDLRTYRVERLRMIAARHFMDQRFFAFNAPVAIEPPAGGAG